MRRCTVYCCNCIDFSKRGWERTGDAEFSYESNLPCPDRWITARAVNDDGKEAILYWYYTKTQEKVFDRTEDGADLVSNWDKCCIIEEL